MFLSQERCASSHTTHKFWTSRNNSEELERGWTSVSWWVPADAWWCLCSYPDLSSLLTRLWGFFCLFCWFTFNSPYPLFLLIFFPQYSNHQHIKILLQFRGTPCPDNATVIAHQFLYMYMLRNTTVYLDLRFDCLVIISCLDLPTCNLLILSFIRISSFSHCPKGIAWHAFIKSIKVTCVICSYSRWIISLNS